MAKVNALTQGRKRKGDEAAIAGRLDEAQELFESVCRGDPTDVEARVKLGMVLKRLGDYKQAEAQCRKAVLLQPKLGFAHFGLGNALQCLGRMDEAVASYRKTTQLQPDFADGHYLLGNALHELGAKAEAVASYRKALALQPDFPAALADLAAVHLDLGELDEAAPLLERALKLQPVNRVALVNRSHLLRLQGRAEEAMDTFRHALVLAPDSVDVLAGLAGLLEKTGKLDEAARIVQEGLDMEPDHIALNVVAANLDRRNRRHDEAIVRLDSTLQRRLSASEKSEVLILLAQLCDQVGQVERAYELIVEGKKLKGNMASHESGGIASYLARVAKAESLATEKLGTIFANCGSSGTGTPVFLVGFPRSGTTLMEQMLASHPEIQTMEEKGAVGAMLLKFRMLTDGESDSLAALDEGEIRELQSVYFGEVQRHMVVRPGATFIDKLPLNIVDVPLIWRVFPDAKFILAIRHPCDSCLSCLMQDFSMNEAMASFCSLESTVNTYSAVMTAWQKYVQILPLTYHRIRYEDLIADVEGQMRSLLDFLGVGWNASVMEHTAHAQNKGAINTPSYHQVTQPIYQSAKYRWKRYEAAFKPVLSQLHPFIDYFGYGSD